MLKLRQGTVKHVDLFCKGLLRSTNLATCQPVEGHKPDRPTKVCLSQLHVVPVGSFIASLDPLPQQHNNGAPQVSSTVGHKARCHHMIAAGSLSRAELVKQSVTMHSDSSTGWTTSQLGTPVMTPPAITRLL